VPVFDGGEVRACLSGWRRALVELARVDPGAAARFRAKLCAP
jgi:hypothetical protein